MARDPLAMLLRLRAIALDSARRGLAQRLAEEAAAVAHADALDAEIARETALHLDQTAETRAVDSFAPWRGRAQFAQRAAGNAMRVSAAATAEARASINAARAEARALEAMLARTEEHRRNAAARTEQRALDEAGAFGRREAGMERVTGIEPA